MSLRIIVLSSITWFTNLLANRESIKVLATNYDQFWAIFEQITNSKSELTSKLCYTTLRLLALLSHWAWASSKDEGSNKKVLVDKKKTRAYLWSVWAILSHFERLTNLKSVLSSKLWYTDLRLLALLSLWASSRTKGAIKKCSLIKKKTRAYLWSIWAIFELFWANYKFKKRINRQITLHWS